ncbi:uncharacterized protein BDV17DRAFT_273709 [Aspergillus undulatus]|uniref:uncharacterized protein n=1 Tax=Aspergillus undulatus TaxID=1810928 RepID=UPI003CCE11C0
MTKSKRCALLPGLASNATITQDRNRNRRKDKQTKARFRTDAVVSSRNHKVKHKQSGHNNPETDSCVSRAILVS